MEEEWELAVVIRMDIIMKPFAFFLPSLVLISCVEATVDASNENTLKTSLERVEASVPESQKTEFTEAYTYLIMSNAMSDVFSGNEVDAASMGAVIDGMTAQEIIYRAKNVRVSELQGQLDSLIGDINRLESEVISAESAISKSSRILESVVISNPKYYWSDAGYVEKPVLDFVVKNETSVAIKKLFANGTLYTPGRSIPWENSEFNYEFAGGLEPGEEEHLRLDVSYSFNANWDNRELKDRDDLVLDVSVLNFTGADDEKIVSASQDDVDQLKSELKTKRELLASLESQLEALK